MSAPKATTARRHRDAPVGGSRNTGGRILGLPSHTSTGLFAVRNDVVPAAPDSRRQATSTDHGYVALTELSTAQNLNEELQLRLARLTSELEDAVALRAEAEGRAISAEARLTELTGNFEAVLQEVDVLRGQLQAESSKNTGQIEELRSQVEGLNVSLARERIEVQRAVAHAREAGDAADEANDLLDQEEEKVRRLQHQVDEERRRRLAAEETLADAQERLGELEEDIETEREWRESAQKNCREWEDKCQSFQREAQTASAVADRQEAMTKKMERDVAEIRQKHEALEKQRETEAKGRKERAKQRAREVNNRVLAQGHADKQKIKVLQICSPNHDLQSI